MELKDRPQDGNTSLESSAYKMKFKAMRVDEISKGKNVIEKRSIQKQTKTKNKNKEVHGSLGHLHT